MELAPEETNLLAVKLLLSKNPLTSFKTEVDPEGTFGTILVNGKKYHSSF